MKMNKRPGYSASEPAAPGSRLFEKDSQIMNSLCTLFALHLAEPEHSSFTASVFEREYEIRASALKTSSNRTNIFV
jgi:hypothetical protein